jgi:hypothetical protein
VFGMALPFSTISARDRYGDFADTAERGRDDVGDPLEALHRIEGQCLERGAVGRVTAWHQQQRITVRLAGGDEVGGDDPRSLPSWSRRAQSGRGPSGLGHALGYI